MSFSEIFIGPRNYANHLQPLVSSQNFFKISSHKKGMYLFYSFVYFPSFLLGDLQKPGVHGGC